MRKNRAIINNTARFRLVNIFEHCRYLIVHTINNPLMFTSTMYEDLSGAWDAIGSKSPNRPELLKAYWNSPYSLNV